MKCFINGMVKKMNELDEYIQKRNETLANQAIKIGNYYGLKFNMVWSDETLADQIIEELKKLQSK